MVDLGWVACEFLLAPDFGQLMRDPTSLFQALGFPRGGLCLRCSRVPFVLPFLSVLPWLGWEGMLLLLYRSLSILPTVCILVLLSYLPILSVLPCLAFLLAQPSSAVLPPLSVYSVGAVSVSCPCLSSVLGSERSSLRSRGILLYPLCHKAFEPVDNSVFSVDIYRCSVYNYPYLYSVITVVLSVLPICYLLMKVFYRYPFRYSSCYPYCSSSPPSFSSLGNGYLQERASLAIQQRTLRLYRSLRARYSLRVLSYLSRAISLLPASFATRLTPRTLRTVALASMQHLSICSISRSLPSYPSVASDLSNLVAMLFLT